jgi:hypothetical protein
MNELTSTRVMAPGGCAPLPAGTFAPQFERNGTDDDEEESRVEGEPSSDRLVGSPTTRDDIETTLDAPSGSNSICSIATDTVGVFSYSVKTSKAPCATDSGGIDHVMSSKAPCAPAVDSIHPIMSQCSSFSDCKAESTEEDRVLINERFSLMLTVTESSCQTEDNSDHSQWDQKSSTSTDHDDVGHSCSDESSISSIQTTDCLVDDLIHGNCMRGSVYLAKTGNDLLYGNCASSTWKSILSLVQTGVDCMIDSWLFILGCNKSIDGVKGTKKTHIPINSISFTQTTKPKKEAPAQSNVATKVPAIEKKRGFLMRSAPRKLLEIRRRMTPTSRLRLNPNKNEMRHVKVSERQGILRKCGSGYNNGMVRVSQ